MRLSLLPAALLVLSRDVHPQAIARDSAVTPYSSAALRALVATAAAANRHVPAGLLGYRGEAESEMAVLLHVAEGNEAVVQVEQVRSEVRWSRTGETEQHVLGHRQRAIGINFSLLGTFRNGWVVPVLYGNRLSLLFGMDSLTDGRQSTRRRRVTVGVHPLADDRDEFYGFSGGDTTATLRVQGRLIRLVRIVVEPRRVPARPTLLFSGELLVDAGRSHIVRMRGRFLRMGATQSRAARLAPSTTGAFFVELENREVAGRVWLPSYQRVEMQVAVPAITDGRAVIRVITGFRTYELNGGASLPDELLAPRATADDGDSLRTLAHRLTWATTDSLARFEGWTGEIGGSLSSTTATDFDDVAPDVWRPTGPPIAEVRSRSVNDVFRFNRIEGAFTGVGAQVRFRDRAPGLVARANAGWAWSERAMRGAGALEWRRDAWSTELRLSRELANTNDFRPPLDPGATVTALLASLDNYDYVDRRETVIAVGRPGGRYTVRLEGALGADHMVNPHATRGLFARDSGFRDNRGVDEGRYGRTAIVVELDRGVSGLFLRPGLGGRLAYEMASGELAWRRAEAHVGARRQVGMISIALRANAGALWGRALPAQRLFEIGSEAELPGYGYKEFAGDRAATGRGVIAWHAPLLTAPWRLRLPFGTRQYVLPGVAPAFALGAHAGWSELSSPASRQAVARLGIADDSRTGAPRAISRATERIRATVDARILLFGGALGIGIARPVDHRAGWRLSIGT